MSNICKAYHYFPCLCSLSTFLIHGSSIHNKNSPDGWTDNIIYIHMFLFVYMSCLKKHKNIFVYDFPKRKTDHNAFFRNKRFVLNEMFHRNASKVSC